MALKRSSRSHCSSFLGRRHIRAALDAGVRGRRRATIDAAQIAVGPRFEPVERRVLFSAYGVSQMAHFGINANGAHPRSTLVADASGNLYGTTDDGGAEGYGTVFEIARGSTAITTLASFNDADGADPYGGLMADAAGNFYGTTYSGGAHGDGTVFQIASGATAITTRASFDGSDGYAPFGRLTMDAAGNLYGVTQHGGANNNGTVFEIASGSATITTLAAFNGTNGGVPQAGVTLDGAGNLFGTTSRGGSNNWGTVFEIAGGSSAITALASFAAFAGSESNIVVDASGNLFGTSSSAGKYSDGAVFEIPAGSGTMTAFASFNSANGNGPEGELMMDASGNLFGTTYHGGVQSAGSVFEIASGSTAITSLATFTGPNGRGPMAGITIDTSGNLYGTTLYGGTNNTGVVFEVANGSTTPTAIASFDALSGADPLGALMRDPSGNFYGTTNQGGTYGAGTVFCIPNGSNEVTTLASLSPSSGTFPQHGLTMDGAGNLFGTTSLGGASNDGTVFEMAKGSNSVTTLASFNGTNGANPQAGVTLDAFGNLYGSTPNGGAGSGGTVFEIASGSRAITTLASFAQSTFNNPVGWNPSPGVTLDGAGNLYGVTQGGGANNAGAAFEIANGSNAVTLLATFNYTDTPGAGAVFTLDSSGNLYGASASYGPNNAGTVFEIARGSAAITTLAAFNGTNGAGPRGRLTFDPAGNLFGMTTYGGPTNSGTAFEIANGSNAITTLATFSYADGGPTDGLLLDPRGNLYGTTANSGGTIFELSPNTVAPVALVSAPVINGDNPNGLFDAGGQPNPGVQRSMVEDIVYTFNEPVTIPNANAAFTVVGTGPHAGTAPSTLLATAVPGTNGTQWAVSLTGKADGALASIANGEYSISINPTGVFATADGTTAMTTGRTDSFYRLFGDINGDRVVNVSDEFQFSKAMTAYTPIFDVNGDETVNLADEFQASRSFSSGGYIGDGFVTTI